MSTTNELHVIFGMGPLGISVMRELVKRGKQVRMVSRKGKAEVPAGVEVRAGDATDVSQTRVLAQGATVVYNCTNPPYTDWPKMFPPLQAGVLEGAASAGAKLISGENIYMYGEVHGKITEDLPYNAKTRKGRVRAQMALDLLKAHQSGKVRVAIGRASDFYGPRVLDSSGGERVFYPAMEGKKVTMLGDLDALHTMTYIEDFGRALVILGEHDEALGQAWHVPSAETLTARQWVTLVFEATGHKPNIGSVPSFVVKAMGLFMPIMREVSEMLYEFENPQIVDHSKFARAFGDNTTPHREAIQRTLEWYKAHPKKA